MATILAGPAIRRVQEDQINIWLVVDENASVEAHLTLSPGGAAIATTILESQRPVRMGQRLFFYLLKLAPPEGQTFPKERLLYYDILVNGQGLAEQGLTTGTRSITYGKDSLPSLLIPVKHRHILQGSCRKPHAARKSKVAQSDQLTEADRILGQHRNDLDKRPTVHLSPGQCRKEKPLLDRPAVHRQAADRDIASVRGGQPQLAQFLMPHRRLFLSIGCECYTSQFPWFNVWSEPQQGRNPVDVFCRHRHRCPARAAAIFTVTVNLGFIQ